MTTLQNIKYRLLSKIPGRIGRRYYRKYRRRTAVMRFNAALPWISGLASIDLGANVGEFTRLMAEHSREVIAFEPDPWTSERLRSNLLDLPNVRIIQAAASTTTGIAKLYRHSEFQKSPVVNSKSSSLFKGKTNVTSDGSIDVEQIDFLSFLRNLDCDIGIIKIDIEGAEVDILERLLSEDDLLKRILFIFVETHEKKLPEQADRVAALHEKVKHIRSPKIDLYWR